MSLIRDEKHLDGNLSRQQTDIRLENRIFF